MTVSPNNYRQVMTDTRKVVSSRDSFYPHVAKSPGSFYPHVTKSHDSLPNIAKSHGDFAECSPPKSHEICTEFNQVTWQFYRSLRSFISCSVAVSCTFNRDTCGWTNVDDNDHVRTWNLCEFFFRFSNQEIYQQLFTRLAEVYTVHMRLFQFEFGASRPFNSRPSVIFSL